MSASPARCSGTRNEQGLDHRCGLTGLSLTWMRFGEKKNKYGGKIHTHSPSLPNIFGGFSEVSKVGELPLLSASDTSLHARKTPDRKAGRTLPTGIFFFFCSWDLFLKTGTVWAPRGFAFRCSRRNQSWMKPLWLASEPCRGSSELASGANKSVGDPSMLLPRAPSLLAAGLAFFVSDWRMSPAISTVTLTSATVVDSGRTPFGKQVWGKSRYRNITKQAAPTFQQWCNPCRNPELTRQG